MFTSPHFYSKSEVPKFTGKNEDWALWKIEFQLYSTALDINLARDSNGLWDRSQLADSDEETQVKDKQLAWALMTALPRTWLLSYQGYISRGVDLFNALEAKYERRDTGLRRVLELEMLNVRYINSADGYIHTLLASIEKFQSAGGNISNERKVEILIGGLPSNFDALKDAFDADPTMTWEEATLRIRRKFDRMRNERRISELQAIPNSASQSIKKSKSSQRHSSSTAADVSSSHPKKEQKPIVCHHCHTPGHKRPDCPNREKPDKKRTKGHAKLAAAASDDDVCFAGSLSSKPPSRKDRDMWSYDSCCSLHLTPYRDLLDNYETCDGEIEGVDGSSAIVGRGTVTCYVTTDTGAELRLTFTAHYAPTLPQNLLSSYLGKQKGHALLDLPQDPHILLSSGSKLPVTVVDKLPTLKVRYAIPSQPLKVPVSTEPSELLDEVAAISLHRWHERLGHADYNAIKMLPQYVTGMKVSSSKSPEVCDPCRMAKSRRKPFPKEAQRRAKSFGQRVFVDTQGALPTVSRQGNSYVLMFVDDATRFKFIYFMKAKSDAPKMLLQFLKDVRYEGLELSMTVVIRSDEAPDLAEGEFARICDEHNIEREFTCADSPQQNAVVERALAIITADARTCLEKAHLPEEFWEDAFDYCVRVRNRLLTKAADRTPFELVYGKPPDLSQFRVFGCVAYDLIPKLKRNKLQPTSRRMIFVGFKNRVKGFRLYNPETGSERMSHDATFYESMPGGHLIPETTQDAPEDNDESFIPEEDNDDGYSNLEEAEEVTLPEGRPQRVRKKPGQWYIAGHALLSYNKAMKSNDANHWDDAMKLELAALESIGTWEPCPLPHGCRAIKSMWRLTVKRDKNGNILRYKARLVARGDTQQEGKDYDEVFAPVASHHVLHLFCAIAVKNGWLLKHIDFTTAFLNAPLKEDIFMTPPQGMTLPRGQVLKLLRSLYGLKQAGRNWFLCLRDYLSSIGFTPLLCDMCVCVRHSDEGYVAISIHVDDLLAMASSEAAFAVLITELSSQFKVGEYGDLNHYCGIAVERSEEKIILSQNFYTKQVLQDFSRTALSSRTTPAESRLVRAVPGDTLVDQKPYRKFVGALLWLSRNTRPDITFAVHQLTKHCSAPTSEHWAALKMVMRYLSGDPRGIEFCQSASLQPVIYADADWGGDPDTRTSTLGQCVLMSGPVFWRAIRPKHVTLSSAEAEYCAQSEASRTVLFLKNMLEELAVNLSLPVTMYCDNQSAIAMANSLKSSMRNRHMDIKYHFVRQQVEQGIVALEWISTQKMIADIFTKPLKKALFERLRDCIVVKVDHVGRPTDN